MCFYDIFNLWFDRSVVFMIEQFCIVCLKRHLFQLLICKNCMRYMSLQSLEHLDEYCFTCLKDIDIKEVEKIMEYPL